jgi:midasin (ATPase involved in ribosome maturation)
LHFDEIPTPELEIILHKRCDMPLSYCKKMVSVMTVLQVSSVKMVTSNIRNFVSYTTVLLF